MLSACTHSGWHIAVDAAGECLTEEDSMLDSFTSFLVGFGVGLAAGLVIGWFVWGNS